MMRRAVIVIALVVLPLVGAYVGRAAAPALARANRILVAAENAPKDAILQIQSREIRERFATGAAWFGAWCGLIAAVQIALVLRRRAPLDYEIDPMTCVECGRCWTACPVERKRVRRAEQAP